MNRRVQLERSFEKLAKLRAERDQIDAFIKEEIGRQEQLIGEGTRQKPARATRGKGKPVATRRERGSVLNAVRKLFVSSPNEVFTPETAAQAIGLGIDAPTVSATLNRLWKKLGEIDRIGHGKYRAKSVAVGDAAIPTARPLNPLIGHVVRKATRT